MANPNPITSTAAAIAAQLGETAPGACATIWRTVRTLGPERAQAFVAQALEVEASSFSVVGDEPPGFQYLYLGRWRSTEKC